MDTIELESNIATDLFLKYEMIANSAKFPGIILLIKKSNLPNISLIFVSK